MKKVLVISILIAVLMVLTGCSSTPTPKGILYTGTKGPFYATANDKGDKVGSSTARCILGAVAWGDASTAAAAKNAGITKIHHADYEDTLVFFGIYSSYTVVVYGE